MIVQLPISCTDRMKEAQIILEKRNSWIYTFDDRPGKLFDNLQHIRATIFLTKSSNNDENKVFTSKYIRWYSETRNTVFETLEVVPMTKVKNIISLPKLGSKLSFNIIQRINGKSLAKSILSDRGNNGVYVHNAPQYFTRITTFQPHFWNEIDGEKLSVSVKEYKVSDKKYKESLAAVLNSNIFYLWFILLSDCRHLNKREIENFPIGKIIH